MNNLIDMMEKIKIARYEEAVGQGFKGTIEEWNKRSEESKIEDEKEKNSDQNKVYTYHAYHNKFLPAQWTIKTFENFKYAADSKLQKIVNVLSKQDLHDSGFWLSGGVGCGKTHLLLSVFNMLSLKLLSSQGTINGMIKYYNYSDLCGLLREDPNNFEKFCKIRSPAYLFIDDIGVSKSSDFIQEKIYSLFNYRVEHNLTTFVTTNLNLSELQHEFNDRLVSRIKESAAWLEMKDVADYRSSFISENMKRFKDVLK